MMVLKIRHGRTLHIGDATIRVKYARRGEVCFELVAPPEVRFSIDPRDVRRELVTDAVRMASHEGRDEQAPSADTADSQACDEDSIPF